MGRVYVLKLEDGCYYIGYTNYFQLRMNQHFNRKGAKFTRLHPPIKILEVFDNATPALEHVVTKRYIRKYGVARVRGGDWVGTTRNSYCPAYYLPKKKVKRAYGNI
jgi:predicted GIY-YIG superfamily endonuclease